MFPLRSFYIIAPFITQTVFWAHGKLDKKNHVLNSQILNLFENNHVISLSLLFRHSSSNSFSIPEYLSSCVAWYSFFNISIFIFCCPWSEVCMILAFPLHPFAYFLICFELPITRTFFDFPRRVWVIRSQMYPFKNLLSQSNLL